MDKFIQMDKFIVTKNMSNNQGIQANSRLHFMRLHVPKMSSNNLFEVL